MTHITMAMPFIINCKKFNDYIFASNFTHC